ncbi:MAG: hypothetical protein J0M24_25445 [Verrucomicrobia bacterium]|nr:hypothetical protein [Verrucomicrobiota bacterium]
MSLRSRVNEGETSGRWLGALLVASTVLLTGCDETMRMNYPSAAAARADGAVQRGWLPGALPDSATNISEAHDLDINTGGGSFLFGATDVDSFRAQLRPASDELVNQHFRHANRLRGQGYHFYAVSQFVLAVDWQTRSVYFVIKPSSR